MENNFEKTILLGNQNNVVVKRSFLECIRDILVTIRAHSKGMHNIDVIKVVREYSEKIDAFSEIEDLLGKIKNINPDFYFGMPCPESSDSQGLKIERFRQYFPILCEGLDLLEEVIEQREYVHIHDLADALHNFPEFIYTSTWGPQRYWELYLVPYRQKWKKDFLENHKKDFFADYIECHHDRILCMGKDGLTYLAHNNNKVTICFKECRENWIKYLNEYEDFIDKRYEEETICVGWRNLFSQPSYVELFTDPHLRFIFLYERTLWERLTKRSSRKKISNFLYLQNRINECGWTTFDLG